MAPSEKIMAPHPINPAEVGRFSIDDDGRLYWDGKVLQTAVSLTHKQSVWAVILAIATLLAALATVANAGANIYVAFFKSPVQIERRESPAKSDPASAVQPQGVPPDRAVAPPAKR